MAYSLRARVVFPVDRPAIEHGVVTIDGERIVAVGTKPESSSVTDLGCVALLPGLVNAHTHLEFSHLKQPLGGPGMALVDWIRLVIAERGRREISPLVSMMSGLVESLQHGVTTLCDVVAGSVSADFWFNRDVIVATEIIGFSRARAAASFSAVIERLDAMRKSEGGYGVTTGCGARLAVSPHAPYTVSPDLLAELVDLAGVRRIPVVMHLAESAEELKFLRHGTGPFRELLEERGMWDGETVPLGSRPLDYLRMLAGAPRALVIHGNYLDAEEQAFLAANVERMSLVYCPRTHSYFDHPRYPLPQLWNAGVRVVLGTDSRASNPDLSLLGEMRHVAGTFPMIDPHEILRMGTLAGAEALGRAADVGSITPGRFANLVAVPLPEDARGAPDELLAALFAATEDVCAVWWRGERTGS